jgi:hypothetical protein
VTKDGAFSLVELKAAESTENPIIALLEVLAYGAIVRDNLISISGELIAKSGIRQPLTKVRFFLIAPGLFWVRWKSRRRRQRWDKFCQLHHELSLLRFRIDCLELNENPYRCTLGACAQCRLAPSFEAVLDLI